MQQLEIHETKLEEVPLLLEICGHPLVRPHQYKLSTQFADLLRRQVAGDRVVGIVEYRYDTIEFRQAVVGYITHCHYRLHGNQIAILGWNLHPDHWGQGLMPAAVSMLISQYAVERQTQFFIADCFRQNTRCKRVLAKLGFVQVYIPWFQRVRIAVNQQCLHWIERFQLDYANRPSAGTTLASS